MTATWPADWDAMLAGRDCSMCAKGRPDDDGFGVRIQAAKYSDAYLQRADMQRGYTLVIWRGRHVAEPTELEAAEAAEYWLEVLRVAKALQRSFRTGRRRDAPSPWPHRSRPWPPSRPPWCCRLGCGSASFAAGRRARWALGVSRPGWEVTSGVRLPCAVAIPARSGRWPAR
jgi:hypothetical protein